MRRSKQSGQMLVQVLVAIGILGIVSAGIVQTILNMSRENQAMSEKLAANDFTRAVNSVLSVPNACSLMFTKLGTVINPSTLTFNPSGAFPFLINLNGIPSSATEDLITLTSPTVSTISNSLTLSPTNGIQIEVTSPTTANLWVYFDQAKLIRPIKDLRFPLQISTIPVGGNLRIDGCANAASAGTCPAGFVMIGGSHCISQVERPALPLFAGMNSCMTAAPGFPKMPHLCGTAEWYMACRSGAATGMTGNWEWVADLKNDDVAMAFGQLGCANNQSPGVSFPYPYRCCVEPQ